MNLILVLGIGIVLSSAVFARRETIVQRVNLKYVNTKYVNCNVSMRKINRIDIGFSLYLTLYRDDILEHGTISIQVYSLHNNEYRLEPVYFKRKLCTFFDMEWKLVCRDFQKHGNLPCSCPMPKGEYYLKDYVADVSNALQVPWTYIRIDANATYKDILIAQWETYIKFDKDAKLINPFLTN